MFFPVKGIHLLAPSTIQPELTCVNCLNVRAFDTLEERMRGGIRPGLKKFIANQIATSGRIQDLNYITTTRDSDPAAAVVHIRAVYGVCVANGVITKYGPGWKVDANTAGARSLANTIPFVFSANMFDNVYFTDGKSYKVWDATTNNTSDWTASAGSLPGTDGTKVPRLVEAWDTRIVLAAYRSNAHEWYMSAKGDADDWDYSPANTTEIQAVSGAVGVVGKMGDKITCMIPYSDDILIFGCDHTIWQMSGNPMSGGRIDNISTSIGIAFGRPWCKKPDGTVLFFSNHGGVYTMTPVDPEQGNTGASIKKISEAIDSQIRKTNLNTHLVRMAWNAEEDGAHLWISPLTTGSATHWWFDGRTGGWFKDTYANTNHNPIAVCTFDGDLYSDRRVLMGGEDAYIRYPDETQMKDDGTVFPAHFTLGPINSGEHPQHIIISKLQTRSDPDGNDLRYEIMHGDTPEAALDTEIANLNTANTVGAGLSFAHNPMLGGYYHYIKFGTNNAAKLWSFEHVLLGLQIATNDTSGTHRG